MKFIKCPKCKGTGKLQSQAEIGAKMRKLREKAGLSLRKVALGMAISAAHLSDLELGRKNWNEDHIRAFKTACS